MHFKYLQKRTAAKSEQQASFEIKRTLHINLKKRTCKNPNYLVVIPTVKNFPSYQIRFVKAVITRNKNNINVTRKNISIPLDCSTLWSKNESRKSGDWIQRSKPSQIGIACIEGLPISRGPIQYINLLLMWCWVPLAALSRTIVACIDDRVLSTSVAHFGCVTLYVLLEWHRPFQPRVLAV